MEAVSVESPVDHKPVRTDISFNHKGTRYLLELKTPNASWRKKGIANSRRPISRNIRSIVDDTKKLDSNDGIIAFLLFPVPTNDDRWIVYFNRIAEKTQLNLTIKDNCSIVNLPVDEKNYCDVVVCTYMSKEY